MLNLPSVRDNLKQYKLAGFPILYIHTFEESKADDFIKKIPLVKEVLEWNGANGLVNFKTKVSYGLPSKTLDSTLTLLASGKELDRKILVLKDISGELNTTISTSSNIAIALLKEIARKIRLGSDGGGIDATIIIVASVLSIPPALEKLVTVLELNLPNEDEIKNIITEKLNKRKAPKLYEGFFDKMAIAFKGLSQYEIEDLLHLALGEKDGELTDNSLKMIYEQKRQMIMKAGILEMVQVNESLDDIGGLENLKEWLSKKARVFKDFKNAEEFGVVSPKGVLIAGMPGCGKSLCAKAAGALFDIPLLRLDMGRIMGRYVGESEENMRKAIQLAEAISPCILWIDELEKAFAGVSGGGSEVTTRLFGAILTWMQDKKSQVFVLATANKMKELPPELLRKGRFDEIFYVTLPEDHEREKIFKIHIEKRKQDISKINIDTIVVKTKGYTGADIEGVVNESVENAFLNGSMELTTDDLLITLPGLKLHMRALELMSSRNKSVGMKTITAAIYHHCRS